MKLKRVMSILVVIVLLTSVGFLSVACLQTTAEEGAAAGGTESGETSTAANVFANYGTWVWLAILAVAFYFLLIRPQRTRTKKAQELMSSLQRGEEIVTIGGFHGRIKEVREDVIIITIASGVDVKVSKSAIARKVTQQ